MSTVEACEVCEFQWDTIGPEEVVPRLTAAIAELQVLLGTGDVLVRRRPEPLRWSVLEYGAHVRDVLLNMRDRIFVALSENDPVTKPMYRDVRIPFYADESSAEQARELGLAARLFTRTFALLTPEQLARVLVAGYPQQTSRSVLWIASQVLHEAEHHLSDAQDNIATLSQGS